jgi:hypothetical protein
MKDLEDKYTRMLRRMDGEDLELMDWICWKMKASRSPGG